MTPDMVADVGNTRVKWGVCAPDEPRFDSLFSLPPDPAAWEVERASLGARPLRWLIASVQPASSDRLMEWLRGRGDQVTLLKHADIPVTVNVERPDKVGIDRLLNAAAANQALAEGEPAVIVDAGSAVTVDYLDEAHVFQGGTIFPGLDLMAEALHRYTALLPRVEVKAPMPPLPGKATIPAMQLGILHAVAGGIRSITAGYAAGAKTPPRTFITGGQARTIIEAMGWDAGGLWPEMTLMGILFASWGLP